MLTPDERPSRGPAPTSVHPQETSAQNFDNTPPPEAHPLSDQSRFQLIAHRHHERLRMHIINALHVADAERARQRARRIGACCCCPTFRIRTDGTIGANLARCRDRLCPLCAARRGQAATLKTTTIVSGWNTARLITLTLKSRPEPLRDTLVRLGLRFKDLRRSENWKKRVRQGVWTVEVTRNADTGHWHAHVHAIVDGDYYPQELLKKQWSEITGDSYIVDIRAVHDRAGAAFYVSQYVSKPPDLLGWSYEGIEEYAEATHGRRMIQTFGIQPPPVTDEDDADIEPTTSSHLCDAHALARAITADDTHAKNAREILFRLSPDHAIACGITPNAQKPNLPPPTEGEITDAVYTLRRIAQDYANGMPTALPPVGKREPQTQQLELRSGGTVFHR